MSTSICQQTLVMCIADYILCLIKYLHNIHLGKVKRMCMLIYHPIITSLKDIEKHMFEFYYRQKINNLHIDKHICLYLDQHK